MPRNNQRLLHPEHGSIPYVSADRPLQNLAADQYIEALPLHQLHGHSFPSQSETASSDEDANTLHRSLGISHNLHHIHMELTLQLFRQRPYRCLRNLIAHIRLFQNIAIRSPHFGNPVILPAQLPQQSAVDTIPLCRHMQIVMKTPYANSALQQQLSFFKIDWILCQPVSLIIPGKIRRFMGYDQICSHPVCLTDYIHRRHKCRNNPRNLCLWISFYNLVTCSVQRLHPAFRDNTIN